MPGKGKPFVKGNPDGRAGRPPGVPNKSSRDARELAQKLVTGLAYVAGLRQRLIDGKLGALEGSRPQPGVGKELCKIPVDGL
jgi:hypothetical protein